MTVVREPVPADARRCAEVHVESWKAGYDGVLPDEYLRALSTEDRLPWWTATLANHPDGRGLRVLLAEDPPGHVCGLGSSTREADSSVAEIAQLYLVPEAWGSGAAEALLSQLIADLCKDGVSEFRLRVADGNGRACRFYERCGWLRVDGSEASEEVWGIDVVTVEYRLPVGRP